MRGFGPRPRKMELIRGFHNLREQHRGCVLSIGNYDGVHRGHQALLARLKALSCEHRLPAVVQVFEPTPREYFAADQAPGRVQTLRDKLASLAGVGVDRTLCVRFGRQLAAMPADEFVVGQLVRRLGVRAVVIGDDFRFGAGRGGDLAMLKALGEQHGFSAESLATVAESDSRISSSAIRAALGEADLMQAERLLGRKYAISGRVRPGQRLGRELGMPTANLTLPRPMAIRYGVYAVEAQMGGQGRWWPAVANIGVRPSVDGPVRRLLETHILGAPGDLYGQLMQVRFRRFIRPEARFESLDALRQQMYDDRQTAEQFFKEN